MVKRARRKGATETFSVSIDRDTKRLLREAADRDHGGNVSSLITELAKDAARRRAAHHAETERLFTTTAPQENP